MEDLNEKLNRLLSDPEGMAKIQSMLSTLKGANEMESPPPAPTATELPDTATLARLLPLFSGAQQDNEDTRLLLALKPYLHGQRAQRLEESMRLLRLAKLLPLLQEQGILSGGGGHYGG